MDESTMFRWMEGDSLAPPCQSEDDVILPIMELLQTYLHPHSVLYDLGCGDGRICIVATQKYNCYSKGVEIEEDLVQKFRASISEFGLEEKVTALHENLLNIDINDASVVVVYLLPEAIELIKPKLVQVLERDGIVVCNTWGIKDLQPAKIAYGGISNNVNIYLFDKSSLPR